MKGKPFLNLWSWLVTHNFTFCVRDWTDHRSTRSESTCQWHCWQNKNRSKGNFSCSNCICNQTAWTHPSPRAEHPIDTMKYIKILSVLNENSTSFLKACKYGPQLAYFQRHLTLPLKMLKRQNFKWRTTIYSMIRIHVKHRISSNINWGFLNGLLENTGLALFSGP
jgi:hypothetical protein